MGIADYTPLGIIGNAIPDDGDQSMLGGGGSDSFIDQGTGQEISGAYWACGACGHVPIREGDSRCPACGDSVDWDPNNPEHHAT